MLEQVEGSHAMARTILRFVGIRPVAPDKHREMEVRSVRIRTTGPKGTPPEKPANGLLP